MNKYQDIGKGMLYCKEHNQWFPKNSHCERCQIVDVDKCVIKEELNYDKCSNTSSRGEE